MWDADAFALALLLLLVMAVGWVASAVALVVLLFRPRTPGGVRVLLVSVLVQALVAARLVSVEAEGWAVAFCLPAAGVAVAVVVRWSQAARAG